MLKSPWIREAIVDEKLADVEASKLEEMRRVAYVIRMAQRAKPTELLAVKAGLNAAFGDDWRRFNCATGTSVI